MESRFASRRLQAPAQDEAYHFLVIDVINHHKPPIFQTLLLDHLPPELCHRIMGFLPSDDARYFGYTRHFLREISLQYIRYVRTFHYFASAAAHKFLTIRKNG